MRALPSQLATRLYLRTPPAQKLFCSPVRLTPAVGVTSGAHYQTSIQDVLHPRSRSQIAAHTPFFALKMHFFLKKFAYVQFLLYLCTAFRYEMMYRGVEQW